MKESGNIRNSWTKAIEKTVRKFCTTASRIKKDAVRSVKAANIAIGISAITIGKMKLEQLKKKLPNINISIDYTGTWKDSLQLGLGIVTTGGGLLLTLAGGGSEIASVGSSSAISIPAATEGIGIAGSGLAISFDALRNMFDVRIQKSESSKGDGGGESGSSSGYRVSDSRRNHILEGEGPTDPGHGPNRGFTEGAFPDTWTDEQVISAIEDIANNPNSTWKQSTGPGAGNAPITVGAPDVNAPSMTNKGTPVRFMVKGRTHGLNITVIVEPHGEGIITGYNSGK